jgi:hypothetical protein
MTFKVQWYRDKFAKKRDKGFCGYPVATVAFYGPDDTRATKISVGIVAHEGADADPVERWFCKATDARTDPEVTGPRSRVPGGQSNLQASSKSRRGLRGNSPAGSP